MVYFTNYFINFDIFFPNKVCRIYRGSGFRASWWQCRRKRRCFRHHHGFRREWIPSLRDPGVKWKGLYWWDFTNVGQIMSAFWNIKFEGFIIYDVHYLFALKQKSVDSFLIFCWGMEAENCIPSNKCLLLNCIICTWCPWLCRNFSMRYIKQLKENFLLDMKINCHMSRFITFSPSVQGTGGLLVN